MAEETLTIADTTFISSTRAAELYGYTKDYIGQLCRANKVEAQLIGRSWYVSSDSLRKHKLSVHHALKKPKQRSDSMRASEKPIYQEESLAKRDMHDTADHSAPHYAEVVGAKSDTGTIDSNEWLPQLNKKTSSNNNALLVGTDIRYERETPQMYDNPRPDEHSTSSTSESDTTYVPVRVPRTVRSEPRRRVLRNTRPRHPRNVETKSSFLEQVRSRSMGGTSMDGVVVHSHGELSKRRTGVHEASVRRNRNMVPDQHNRVKSDDIAESEQRTVTHHDTMIVAVLSTLVVLMILILLYSVLT